MSEKWLKVTSDGVARNTKVVDPSTGKALPGVTKVEIVIDGAKKDQAAVKVRIEAYAQLDIQGVGEVVLTNGRP
jgi:hypothetical protein